MQVNLIHVVLVCTLVPLFDFLWLGRSSEVNFKSKLWAVIAVNACLILGILVFVIPESQSLLSAIGFGSILGFVTYGILNFTNMAIKKDWNVSAHEGDIIWGAFLCSTVSAMVYAAGQISFVSIS